MRRALQDSLSLKATLKASQGVRKSVRKKTDRRAFIKRSATQLTILPLSAVAADHLGCQLALMGAITAGLSVVGADDQKRAAYEALGREFFTLHMRWPATLLVQTRQQAQTPFYGALGRCTADFLEMESLVWSESKSA